MNFIKTDDDEKAQEYSTSLPTNEIICKEMLEILGNSNTSVVIEKDLKNSYYVFLNNRIYIADNRENNTLYTRVTLIAHECIHSIQSKILQILNYIFSNIELISFILIIALKIFKGTTSNMFLYSYLGVVVISIVLRLILEIHAVINSILISKKYLLLKLEELKVNTIISSSSKYIKIYMLFFIISLCFSKIIRSIIVFFVFKLI